MACSRSFCLERIWIGRLQNKTKVMQRPIKRNFNITVSQSKYQKTSLNAGKRKDPVAVGLNP